MDYTVLEKNILFSGIPAEELRDDLEAVPHHIQFSYAFVLCAFGHDVFTGEGYQLQGDPQATLEHHWNTIFVLYAFGYSGLCVYGTFDPTFADGLASCWGIVLPR